MKTYIKLFLTLCLINNGIALAQREPLPGITQLKKANIGEVVPSYELFTAINYPFEKVNLQDFKDKVLILDFWTFGCTACVESWPKLMELQKDFEGKIQIITINIYNNEQETKNFIARQEKINNYKMTLPVALQNKEIKQIFPHASVPHVVFIDHGQVKYITSGKYLNKGTIDKILQKKQMYISEKTDDFLPYNWVKEIQLDGNIIDETSVGNTIWSSVINPYNPAIRGFRLFRKTKEVTTGWIGNASIKTMFQALYGSGQTGPSLNLLENSRVVFRDIDSTKYVGRIKSRMKDSIMEGNLYSIQLRTSKDVSLEQVKKKMISDLEGCFGLKTIWEMQSIPCLVISRTKDFKENYDGSKKVKKRVANELEVNGLTMKEFISAFTPVFKHPNFEYPVLDETNFNGTLGKIHIQNTKTADIKLLGQDLIKYGLKFSIENRAINLLIITKGTTN